MKAPRHFARLAAGILVIAAACGGSDATAPVNATTGLRADEAADLAVAMGTVLSSTGIGMTHSTTTSGVAAAVIPVSYSIDQTVPCPKGGSTKLSGSLNGQYDAATQSMTIDVTATQTPQDCGVLAKGITFTTTGAPNLTSTAHFSVLNGNPSGSFTSATKGGFSWKSSDGRTGNCTVDYTSTANFTSNTVQVTGSFCGTSLNYSGGIPK